MIYTPLTDEWIKNWWANYYEDDQVFMHDNSEAVTPTSARLFAEAVLARSVQAAAPTQERSDAYDKTDYHLRCSLHDSDYAEFSEALNCLYAPPVAAEAPKPARPDPASPTSEGAKT